MNAIRTPAWKGRAVPLAFAIGLLAPLASRAEVGVVKAPGSVDSGVIFTLDGDSEDPTPISGVWKRLTAPTDSLHVDLNTQGYANGDGAPTIVRESGSGLIVAAWSRNSASGFDIVVSRFEDAAWTSPQVVVGSAANELDPQLVLDPDGSVHMFYWIDGATPQVFHVVAPSDLSSWSAAEPVSQPGQPACRPAGAIFNGVLRVAYEVHVFGSGSTPRQVVLARYESGTFTPEIVAMTNNAGDVRPQVHGHSGHLWVDWVDAEAPDGSGEAGWTRLDAQGHWETIRFQSFADRIERDYLVRGGVRMAAIE